MENNYDSRLALYKNDPDYQIIKSYIDSSDGGYNDFYFENDYTTITTGKYQRKSIKNFLFPSKIKKLIITNEYNVCLCNVDLPQNLEKLELSGRYNQPLNCVKFPDKLKHLILGSDYDQSLTNVIFPNNLKKITFQNEINENFIGIILPSNLEHVVFANSFLLDIDKIIFPEKLKKISFNIYHESKDTEKFLKKIKFPKNLEELRFGGDFNCSIHTIKFPSNLKKISFNSSYNKSINSLPQNLEILHYDKMNTPILNLTTNLKKIIIEMYSTERPSYSCNKLLNNMVKLPYNCQIVDKHDKVLNIENTYV